MDDLDSILEWIQQSPEINRKRLCEKFEDDNRFALNFAEKHLKYKDFVKHFIVESNIAYIWARDIGDEKFMRHKITNSYVAYLWARDIGDEEFMKHKIINSKHAYYWAYNIGDQEFMKHIIEENGDSNWIGHWNDRFENDQI